jgi:type II secretion system protein N
LRRAEIVADWGSIRYSFPRSIVLVGSAFRVNWRGQPIEIKVDRAMVTPHFSSLWGAPGAHVEAGMGGGILAFDAEAGPARSIRFVAQGIPIERLPTGLFLPWDIRGLARGSGTLRWTGSLIHAEGTLEWKSDETEFDGIRWLGAAWPPIHAESAEGRITLAGRRLTVDFRTTGGNGPFEAAGTVSLSDRLGESPVDLSIRIRPAPEVVASLGDTGVAFRQAQTAESIVALGVTGPLETAEARIR